MKRILTWSALTVLLVIATGVALRSKYVLDSKKLEAAIEMEIPAGTPKAKVLEFIQQRKPLAWDDLGTHIKARISGRAGNLIYRKDIVLDFEFDPNGKLTSYTATEYLTFL